MKFVERKAKDQFKKGDVIRFKNKRDDDYCYALIAELPCSEHRNAAIILGNNGPVHAGDTFEADRSRYSVTAFPLNEKVVFAHWSAG